MLIIPLEEEASLFALLYILGGFNTNNRRVSPFYDSDDEKRNRLKLCTLRDILGACPHLIQFMCC